MKLGFSSASEDAMTKYLGNFERNGKTATLHLHSQGALVGSNALYRMSGNLLSRINLRTYGGASYSFPNGLMSQKHYMNRYDLVPLLFGINTGVGTGNTVILQNNFSHGFGNYIKNR